MTRAIQRLEAELGEKLFVRDNRSVELTAAGIAFKKYADDVLQRWGRLHDELSSDDVLKGKLSLYCSVTAAYGILPGLMTEYRDANPDVRIHLETGDTAKALAKLSNQDADVVIAALPDTMPKEIVFQTITQMPLVFIAPLQYPEIVIYGSKKINWEKL